MKILITLTMAVITYVIVMRIIENRKRVKFFNTISSKSKDPSNLFKEGQSQFLAWRMSNRNHDLYELKKYFNSHDISDSDIDEWAHGFSYAYYSELNQAAEKYDIPTSPHLKYGGAMSIFNNVLKIFKASKSNT